MTTVRSIAENLNLSPATVSRALRGAEGVNEETRAKVRHAAMQLGYAKAARVETEKVVALVVASKSHADMHELARRFVLVLNEEFAKRGWRLHPIFVSPDDQGQLPIPAEFKETARDRQPAFSGCLVVGRLVGQAQEKLGRLLVDRFGGNVVMLSRHDVVQGISGVAQMNYDGGVQAARALLEAGHRHLGWIGSLGSQDTAEERLGGVLTQVLRTSGASIDCHIWLDDSRLLPSDYLTQVFTQALPADRASWPTAWVCSTDWLAAKLMVWLRGQGIRVPADVSVVAFDNTHVSMELAEAVITSVVFPYEQIARKAVELLESLMNSPAADAVVWNLPPRMRVGETVASLPARK